jgi:O-acetyl-ADP-ribose deacetylase (regulator of RNase III)
MIIYKIGNILNATEDIIGHQTNCFGIAGGLAGDIFEKYEKAGKYYKNCCEAIVATAMLGTTYFVKDKGKIIANIFGQFQPGADYRLHELKKALKQLADFAKQNNMSVALPYKLSCGIAGGNWDEVEATIEEVMQDVNVTIYKHK